MCGILVYFDKTKSRHTRYCLNSLADSYVHLRGPDYTMVKSFDTDYGSLVLVNSVLAIKSDKNPHKHPSNTQGSGKKAFLYNGESYLQEWANKVDTYQLVLATSYGKEYIYDRIPDYRGFFSIVSFENDTINMSVDLLSEKSLFYYQDPDILIVGSTIGIVHQALESIDIRPPLNTRKLREYFCTRHLIQYKDTIWNGISRVLPGQVHCINLRELSSFNQSIDKSVTQSYEYLKRMGGGKSLTETICNYMAQCIYDSKLIKNSSFIISGGIDSTLVTLSALDLIPGDHLDTWTLMFGNKDLPAKNARQICIDHNLVNHSINVSWDQYLDSTESLYSFLRYPLPTHSFSSYDIIASEISRHGTRILYGGEGADEIFCGYSLYKDIANVDNTTTSLSPYSSVVDKMGFQIDITDIDQAFISLRRLLQKDRLPLDAIRASLLCDILIQLPSTGLLCVDNIGGRYGIESRSPLANINSLVFTLLNKEHDIVSGLNEGKQILTRLLSRRIKNPKLLPRAKQGFSGYPNEVFSQDQTKENLKVLEELFSHHMNLEPNQIKGAVKWKINNVARFIHSCGMGR